MTPPLEKLANFLAEAALSASAAFQSLTCDED